MTKILDWVGMTPIDGEYEFAIGQLACKFGRLLFHHAVIVAVGAGQHDFNRRFAVFRVERLPHHRVEPDAAPLGALRFAFDAAVL